MKKVAPKKTFAKVLLAFFLVEAAAILAISLLASRPVYSAPHPVYIYGPIEKGNAVRIQFSPEKTVTLVTDNNGNPLRWFPDPSSPQDTIWVKMTVSASDCAPTVVYLYWREG
jgi:hypothetical protein